jgi:site-specific DNA-methyltransferase (adenine-specific)
MFKYCWYWNKVCPTGFLNAKKQPLRQIEEICVFYNIQPNYNPQMVHTGKVRKKGGGKVATSNYGKFKTGYFSENDLLYPKQLLEFSNADKSLIKHPTQKPVELFEYLIKTYTNEGDLVLDNCIGSGTTAIACVNTKRNFIGIELSEEYCKIAKDRLTKLNGGEFFSSQP